MKQCKQVFLGKAVWGDEIVKTNNRFSFYNRITISGASPQMIVNVATNRVRVEIGSTGLLGTSLIWFDDTVTTSSGIVIPQTPPYMVIDRENYGNLTMREIWCIGPGGAFDIYVIETFEYNAEHERINNAARQQHESRSNNGGGSGDHPAGRQSHRLDYSIVEHRPIHIIIQRGRDTRSGN